MITIAHSPLKQAYRSGFTLVEVMVSAALGGILLIAVLTSFLFLGRSGANMQNYAEMESQARRAIERFGQEVRMAKDAKWISSNSLELTVVTSSGDEKTYIYTYDPAKRTFDRQHGSVTTTLLSGISEFVFTAYQINTTSLDLNNPDTLADASAVTKQIQISLSTVRSNRTVADATNTVISARFILRNKRVQELAPTS